MTKQQEKVPYIVIENAGLNDIPIKLNDNEIKEKVHLAAELSSERDEVETRFREVKKNFKAQIANLECAIHDYLAEIKNGMEKRPVECEYHFNFDENSKSLVRKDTGEIVQDGIAITPEERQILIENEKP